MNKKNILTFLKYTGIFFLVFSFVMAMWLYIIFDFRDDGKVLGRDSIYGVKISDIIKGIGNIELFGVKTSDVVEQIWDIDLEEDIVVDRNINVLMVGVDKGGMRTDVMILGNLNLDTQKITMMQIPRDTYVKGNKRYDKKINSAYASGIDVMFREVEIVTGVRIDKYVKVDTSQFREIIDTIGGVEYDVPINMNYDDPVQDLHIHLSKGKQVLDGDKAEQFVRFRKNNNGSGYARGDIERLDAQKGFIKATIKQLFSFKNTMQIPKLVSVFKKMVETNIANADLVSYAPHIFKIPHENIEIITMPGEAQMIGDGSYFVVDKSETSELVNKYFND